MTNTVDYSAGAVCCPNEESARTRGCRATWVEAARIVLDPTSRKAAEADGWEADVLVDFD